MGVILSLKKNRGYIWSGTNVSFVVVKVPRNNPLVKTFSFFKH